MTWYIKKDSNPIYTEEEIKEMEIELWTITTHPEHDGWETNGGADGYGLPKELAQWICDKLNNCGEQPPYIKYFFNWKKRGSDGMD